LFAAAPKFTKSDMKDTLTLNVGASTAVELPFTANPQPKVTWTFKSSSLPDAKRFKTQTIVGMTSLTMSKVVLTDAGDYTVTMTNENGEASFTIKLIVLGEYASPIGILALVAFKVLEMFRCNVHFVYFLSSLRSI